MSELAAKAGLIVVSKAVGALSRIAAIVVLARVLEREDFGLVAFVLLSYITVSSLSQLGLNESVFYFFEKLPRASRRALVLRLAKLLFVVAWGSALVLLLIAWIADGRGYAAMGMFQAMMLLVLIELPTMPIQNVLIAHDKTAVAALVNIGFGIALFLGLAIPALMGLEPVWIVSGLVVYGVIRLLVSSYLVFTRFPPSSERLPAGIDRELLSYSVPLGLANIVAKLNQFIDKYVVMLLLPVAVFAEYTVGSWEIPFVPMIATSVASVMMTRLVGYHFEDKPQELLSLWTRSIEKVSIIVLPLMVLLVAVSYELIVFLFTEKYESAVIIFCIYTLVLFHRVADYAAILRAINQTRDVLRWQGSVLAANALLCVPCVWLFGAPGAALSTLLAVVLGWGYVLLRIAAGFGVQPAAVFPFSFYFKTLCIAGVSSLPLVFLDSVWQLTGFVALLVKVAVFASTYLCLSLMTRVSTMDDWKVFLRSLRVTPSRG